MKLEDVLTLLIGYRLHTQADEVTLIVKSDTAKSGGIVGGKNKLLKVLFHMHTCCNTCAHACAHTC